MATMTEGWRCEISPEADSAIVYVEKPSAGNSFSADDVLEFLNISGVKAGILKDKVHDIVNRGLYSQEIEIAKGIAPVDGVDAYYEFFFDQDKKRKPTIRPDGSVDYQSMGAIESVKCGDTLAIYHPAIKGSHGMDVKGRERRCRMGKSLPELRGFGFEVDEDGVTYRASTEGRVEYSNYILHVRSLYEFRGDLDLITGKIDFRGDVVIHGSVRSGTFIRASKNVTIEGNVEAAIIIAEGDIVLKKGMQGGKKARISAGGNVYAYFLEYTDVSAKGNVEANIIMNCKVSAGDSIIVKGKKGYIVGGNYYAVNKIISTNIGNSAQVRTLVGVGLTDSLNSRNHLLIVRRDNMKKGIEDANNSVEILRDATLSNEPKDVREAKINQIKRRIKRDERMLEHVEKEIEEIRQTMSLGKNAKIVSEGRVFAGTNIKIDETELVLSMDYNNVEFSMPNKDGIEIKNLI